MTNSGFGGISIPYSQAETAILPVPWQGTVTYGKGTADGASAIIEASPNAELFDIRSGKDYEQLKIATLPPLDVSGTAKDVMNRVEEAVAKIISDGKQPFLIGGEHSITAPAARAILASKTAIGMVQIDAHADLIMEYDGTPHSHASVMRRVREMNIPLLQLGIRSCSKEEFKYISDNHLPVYSPTESLKAGLLEAELQKLPEEVYLTIDIDGLDPSIMPATGTPEPGGFGWYDICHIIETVGKIKNIVGMDLVELAPIKGNHAPSYTAAKLAFNMLTLFPNALEE